MSALATLESQHTQLDTSSLLSHGWSTRQIGILRARYGANGIACTADSQNEKNHFVKQHLSWIMPVLNALAGQAKEPLILMLLGSAALSLVLGNTADAVSIAVALAIVSVVAAVQEHRSELALEALEKLAPHACAVLRDGQVVTHCPASELVVGDLILLATGEYVFIFVYAMND
jgi:magnesium-transporting ATPase (P-type)